MVDLLFKLPAPRAFALLPLGELHLLLARFCRSAPMIGGRNCSFATLASAPAQAPWNQVAH
jgi:hypothetical protein